MTDIQNNINTRFIKSACDGNIDEMKLLIDLGADIHKDNDAILRRCAKSNQIEAVKLLLEKGLDVNYCEGDANPYEKGKTALHYAAQFGHTDMVKYLLDNKADIEMKSSLKQNALHFAVDNNIMEVVKLLLERGANIHAKGYGDKEDYALFLSAINDLPKMMNFLLEKGANVNANDDYILRTCAKYNNIKVLEILVSAGANASNNIAMINAIENDNIDCVKLLFDNGATLSTISNVMDICPKNNIKMRELLLNNGATYSQKDNELPVAKLVYDNRILQEKVDKLQKQLDAIKQVINTTKQT